MMKRIYAYCLLAAAAFSLQSCLDMDMAGLYDGDLHSLEILLSPPGDAGDIVFDGAVVRLREINSDADYTAACDDRGVARISLPNGIYMASTSLTGGEYRYGGSVSGIIVGGSDASCSIALARTRVSDIVIKEIYCGGCMKYPQEGTYQTDSYFILHNNSANTVYLDGLCFGTLDPYNSNSAPVWGTDPGFVPIIQAIWQFPGEGSDFPLGAGEDAVVAVFGAIDHSAYYPMSVDLNREDVFVCYNPTYCPNAMWHPAPGDKVSPDRYLSVVIKTGQANAYTFSVSSPALVIFRAEGRRYRSSSPGAKTWCRSRAVRATGWSASLRSGCSTGWRVHRRVFEQQEEARCVDRRLVCDAEQDLRGTFPDAPGRRGGLAGGWPRDTGGY